MRKWIDTIVRVTEDYVGSPHELIHLWEICVQFPMEGRCGKINVLSKRILKSKTKHWAKIPSNDIGCANYDVEEFFQISVILERAFKTIPEDLFLLSCIHSHLWILDAAESRSSLPGSSVYSSVPKLHCHMNNKNHFLSLMWMVKAF